jgi:hypothetical protein
MAISMPNTTSGSNSTKDAGMNTNTKVTITGAGARAAKMIWTNTVTAYGSKEDD